MKQFEELQAKLKICEAHRAEDRKRLKESERKNDEAEQFISIRVKLASTVISRH